MSTSEENDANMLLQKWGFVVIVSRLGTVKKRGDILRGVGSLDQPLVIVGASNAEEWLTQRAYLRKPPVPIPEGALFYRVVAE